MADATSDTTTSTAPQTTDADDQGGDPSSASQGTTTTQDSSATAATAWRKVSQNLRAEDQVQQTIADDGTITDTVVQTFTAETDHNSYGTAVESLTASDGTSSVPSGGQLLVVAGQTFAVTASLARRSGPFTFDVQVTATAKYVPAKAGKYSVTVRISGEKSTQDAYYDKDNKAIDSSAGESFDPTLPETLYDERIEISYQTATDQDYSGVRGCVNGSATNFTAAGVSRSYEADCLLCEDVQQTAAQTQQDGTPTFNVTGTFVYRKDTWSVVVPDKGYYQLNSNGQRVRIMDGDSPAKPIAVPAYLDGSGHVMSLGPVTNPHTLTFKLKDEADFSTFFSGLT